MKRVLTFLIIFLLGFTVKAQAQERSVLLFQQGSDLLVNIYKDNKAELETLQQIVNSNRIAINEGRGHFRIVSFVKPDDSANPAAINNASIQASVLRSWLVNQHRLPRNVTFYIDRQSGFDNRVEVIYVDTPIAANASRTINYTLSRDNRTNVNMAISRYNPIPFLDLEFAAEESHDEQPEIHDQSELEIRSCAVQSKTDLSVSVTKWTNNAVLQTTIVQAAAPQNDAAISAYATQREMREMKPYHAWGLKTNILLLAGMLPDFKQYAPVPNIGVEHYFNERWSVNADLAYGIPKLSATDTSKRFGYQDYAAEIRYWFKRDSRFNGFYAGPYVAYTEFNIMQPKLRDGFGYSGDMYSAGLSVGYVASLSRHLFLEVGLRGGYASVYYKKYHHDGYDFLVDERGNDFRLRLQSVKISFGYRFGMKK